MRSTRDPVHVQHQGSRTCAAAAAVKLPMCSTRDPVHVQHQGSRTCAAAAAVKLHMCSTRESAHEQQQQCRPTCAAPHMSSSNEAPQVQHQASSTCAAAAKPHMCSTAQFPKDCGNAAYLHACIMDIGVPAGRSDRRDGLGPSAMQLLTCSCTATMRDIPWVSPRLAPDFLGLGGLRSQCCREHSLPYCCMTAGIAPLQGGWELTGRQACEAPSGSCAAVAAEVAEPSVMGASPGVEVSPP
eukprot:360618-Chlamydomonas_euryale.AAC.1